MSGSRIAGGSEKRGGTPGRTEGAVGVAVVLMEVPVAESIRERGYTAGAAAALSPVACRRWLRLVDVADADTGRLLEKRTFRRCLPVAAMMGIWEDIFLAKLCIRREVLCLIKEMKSLVP